MPDDDLRNARSASGSLSGGNFRNDPVRAVEAGRKGGKLSSGNFKKNRERAIEAGRKGGMKSKPPKQTLNVIAWCTKEDLPRPTRVV